MKLFTIGFTGTSARNFFERLKSAGVRTVIDTRLNNVSQLAGFAKRDDLEFFAERIAGARYTCVPAMAPTKDLLDAYRKKRIDWPEYERRYNDLIAERAIETSIPRADLDGGCLLCSEAKPHRCHRRLAAEYLKSKLDDIEIVHL